MLSEGLKDRFLFRKVSNNGGYAAHKPKENKKRLF